MRWEHPERGLISPAEFIPVAEHTGSVVQLGQWVFEEACRQLALWRAMDLTQQHAAVFESLSRLGLRTAIDDFSTGYSSLKYLTHYPVTRLKIAQDLVSRVDSDVRNATVVRTAIRLAQELGLDFVAEGVETQAQADFLLAAGCQLAQGFYCGMPAGTDEITRILKEQRARKGPKLAIVAS